MEKQPSLADLKRFVGKEDDSTKNKKASKPKGSKSSQLVEKKTLGRKKTTTYPKEFPLTVQITKSIHKTLKNRATDDERPMADIVTEALISHLNIKYESPSKA